MDLLDRLLEHDRWTTQQVLTICRTLTPKQMGQEFGIGHGSLDETLRHMIRNVQVWTDLMRSRPIQARDAVEQAAVEELPAVFEAIYADFADCARHARDDQRLNDVYLDVLDTPPTSKTFGGTILHVITHNMHHRAELLHMLGRLGIKNLPEGDLLGWEMDQRKRWQSEVPA